MVQLHPSSYRPAIIPLFETHIDLSLQLILSFCEIWRVCLLSEWVYTCTNYSKSADAPIVSIKITGTCPGSPDRSGVPEFSNIFIHVRGYQREIAKKGQELYIHWNLLSPVWINKVRENRNHKYQAVGLKDWQVGSHLTEIEGCPAVPPHSTTTLIEMNFHNHWTLYSLSLLSKAVWHKVWWGIFV